MYPSGEACAVCTGGMGVASAPILHDEGGVDSVQQPLGNGGGADAVVCVVGLGVEQFEIGAAAVVEFKP